MRDAHPDLRVRLVHAAVDRETRGAARRALVDALAAVVLAQVRSAEARQEGGDPNPSA